MTLHKIPKLHTCLYVFTIAGAAYFFACASSDTQSSRGQGQYGDRNGEQSGILWQKSYGGRRNEFAAGVQQTRDPGYIVAGTSFSLDGNVSGHHASTDSADYWLIKIDAERNPQWQKSYGGTGDDEASAVEQTLDGGYIIAGYSNSTNGDVKGNHGGYDYWVLKIDGTGAIQWQKSFGGSGDDEARSVVQTHDGGYIVAGISSSTDGDVTGNHGGPDYWIVKLDANGGLQWEKSLGGSGNDDAYVVRQCWDGNYIVAGRSNSSDGDVTNSFGGFDIWVVKLSQSGAVRWQKSYGGSDDEECGDIQQTSDAGFIIAGSSMSTGGEVSGNHGGYDYWIVKIDSSGVIQWQKSLGGHSDDDARSIWQCGDGSFIVAGNTLSYDGDVTGHRGGLDCWIVKMDASGGMQWQKTFGGEGDDEAVGIQQTGDGGFVAVASSNSSTGDVTGNHGGYDYWVVKFSGNAPAQQRRQQGGGRRGSRRGGFGGGY